jgi:hypothetical protein
MHISTDFLGKKIGLGALISDKKEVIDDPNQILCHFISSPSSLNIGINSLNSPSGLNSVNSPNQMSRASLDLDLFTKNQMKAPVRWASGGSIGQSLQSPNRMSTKDLNAVG